MGLPDEIKKVTPKSIDDKIDQINSKIDETNQKVIEKIGESLQTALSIVDKVTGMKIEAKTCIPLTLVSSTPPVG